MRKHYKPLSIEVVKFGASGWLSDNEWAKGFKISLIQGPHDTHGNGIARLDLFIDRRSHYIEISEIIKLRDRFHGIEVYIDVHEANPALIDISIYIPIRESIDSIVFGDHNKKYQGLEL